MKGKQYIQLISLLMVTCIFIIYTQGPTATERAKERIGKVLGHITTPLKENAITTYLIELRKKILGQASTEPSFKGGTQTEGYLSQITLEAALINQLGLTEADLERLKPLIQEVIERERDHPEYYAFYHGMNKDVMIALDMLKQIYTRSEKVQVEGFEFLRVPTALVQDQTPAQFFERYKDRLKYTLLNYFDNAPEIGAQILSTNLALPGNLIPGESTIYYFSKSKNNIIRVYAIINSIIDFLFANASLPEDYINIVKELILLKTFKIQHILEVKDYGLLLQIFIPKNLVDQTVYISEVAGLPVKGKYKFKASLLLQTLQKNPQLLKRRLKGLQARIILNRNLFSRPGIVKIYRYHMMSEEAYNSWYLPSVQQVTNELFNIWLLQPPIASIIEENTLVILQALESENSDEVQAALRLLNQLINQGMATPQIVQILTQLVQADSYSKKYIVLKAFAALIDNGYEIPQIIQIAKMLLEDERSTLNRIIGNELIHKISVYKRRSGARL